MTLTDDDIKYIEGRFVTQKECEERNDRTQADIAGMREDVRELKTKINMLIGILAGIAVPVLGIAIKMLFDKP